MGKGGKMRERVIFIISELTPEEFLACKNSIENPEPLSQGQCRVSWETPPLPPDVIETNKRRLALNKIKNHCIYLNGEKIEVERIYENELLYVSTNTQIKRYFAIKVLDPEEYYDFLKRHAMDGEQ